MSLEIRIYLMGLPRWLNVKESTYKKGTWVQSLDQEDPLEKEMATHSSTLAWKIPWTEDRGGLQSTGSQRVGHEWATSLISLTLASSLLFSQDPGSSSLWLVWILSLEGYLSPFIQLFFSDFYPVPSVIVVFILSALWWMRIRGLCNLSDGRD